MPLDVATIARAKAILEGYDLEDALCWRAVGVLGDENVYPCKLPDGHEGQCVADTDAAT